MSDITFRVTQFSDTVAPRGGCLHGEIVGGLDDGKRVLVRLNPDSYRDFLSRPEIFPHVAVLSSYQNVPVRTEDGRVQIALKPIFSYPAGGGELPHDQVVAKLPLVTADVKIDRGSLLPGMRPDQDLVSGSAIGTLRFGADDSVIRQQPKPSPGSPQS